MVMALLTKAEDVDLLDDSLDTSNEDESEILGMVEDTPFGRVTYGVVAVAGEEGMEEGVEGVELDPNGTTTLTPNLQTVLTGPFNGQLYVMSHMNTGEVFATAGNKATLSKENSRNSNIPRKRDDRRRATHNEVERKRRDKINNWIAKLGHLVSGTATSGTPPADIQSKGGILAKACEYISELSEVQERLTNTQRDNERLTLEVYKLSQEVGTLKKHNYSLRAQMAQHGISPAPPPLLSSQSPPDAS